jgi:hypothetical protein
MRPFIALALLLSLSAALAADTNIGIAATVTTSPEAEPGAAVALADGRVDTQLTFAVKTAGEGTITFTFDHPRTVSAVRLYQLHNVYYTTAYVIEADADGDGTFERVLAEAKPALQKAWAEHRFTPLQLLAIRFRSTAGVSQGARAHPCLSELQIIGAPEAGDMKKAAELGIPIAELSAVRPISRETPLVVGGRAPAVLAPEDPAYQPAVQELLKALAPFKPEVVKTLEAADPAHRTVICLGSMLTNPLIERLYWNRYTFIDALTPGPGNYLIHTVYDPYPWTGGHNVIVLGCSDPTGALPAVQTFASKLQDGKLPYLVLAGPKPLVSDAEVARIAAAKVNPTFEDFLKSSTAYLKTGGEAHARKAVEALQIVAKLYAEDGQRRDPQTDPHTVLPWNEETQSFAITVAWDAFEENPLIDDALRLGASNAFLHFTRDLVHNVSGYNTITKESPWPEYNHTTFPLLGVYGGARYFQRYYQIADMPDKLQRARYAFTAQANSWKAPEDSDAYLPLVPDHTVTYALAEDDRTYLTSGNLKKYADYVVGVVDNRGLGSGFGDSGFSARPSQAEEALPLALWWTKDPGYLWLLQQFIPGWKNPYDIGLQPERPDRFLGLNVFMLDPHLYDRFQTRPTYNEPFTKAEVAAELAFDKVSFRDSWDPDAQYLLLDGIGRGHHLHFDTNQIVEFVEGSERWLLDHDYLVRNTTEHNMLTVLRDGRGDVLVPSLAGLTATADLPGLAYTDSVVRGYNGCDWRRQILWQRGESFLVADTVTAREAGDYDLELTWKTIDSAGEQRVTPDSGLLAERGAGSAKTQSCLIVDDPDASGGKALLMEQAASRVAFGAALPAGDYRLKIIGYGFDTSSDSLWVSVNTEPNIAFHMPKLKYGVSTGDAANIAESPMVTFKGDGPQLIVVTLRETPPARLDRFLFVDAQGKETVYEAEALPVAPQPSQDLSRTFRLKPVAPVQAFVTNHERAGISVPISIYHQRQGRKLAAGQSVRFCSLMYTSLPAKRRDLQPVPLADNLVAIKGTSPALALLGPATATGLKANVASGLLSPTHLALAGLTDLQLADLRLQADQPVDLQLDLKTGAGVVKATAPAKLVVNGTTITCAAGSTPLALKQLKPAQAIRAINTLLAQRAPAAATQTAAAVKPDQPAWAAFGADADIAVLKTADLQTGQGPCLFVGRGPILHCLDAQGQQLWQAQCGGKVRDLACADLRPDPGLEVLIGSSDTYVYIVSATGQILDKHQMRGVPWARSFGDAAYPLFNVGAWDVNGDGRAEIVATMKNFDLQVLDRDFKLLFKHDWALHGSMQLAFEPTTPGGQSGTVFVGDKYGSVVGISGQGKRAFHSYTSIGDVFFAVGDINGDGKTEVINASSTGDMTAHTFADRKLLWRFDNFGYPVNRVKMADLNADGQQEVLVASGTGYLYVLDGAGKVLWQDRIGFSVNDVLVMDRGGRKLVAYADEAGLIRVADGAGKLVKQWRTEAPPKLLAVQGDALMAALADGRVVAFGL